MTPDSITTSPEKPSPPVKAMTVTSFWPKHLLSVLILSALIGGIYALSQENYLLFHSVVELISIAIAVAIFMLAWNARRLMDNNFLLFIGIAYFLVAIIDLFHTLAYEGMGILVWSDANLPTQLWIAGRIVQAVALLAAPLFLWRKMHVRYAVMILGLGVMGLMMSIFHGQIGFAAWPAFPDCYIEGTGLTAFKIHAEYVICGVLILVLGLLVLSRKKLDGGVFRLMCLSIAATIVSELFFTEYIGVYDQANILGHLFKVVAFFLIYKAIVETGLTQPYRVIFRELDQRVQERTAELSQTVDTLQGEVRHRIMVENILRKQSEQLRALASELTLAEQRERRRLAQVLHDNLQQFLVGAKYLLNPLDRSPDQTARQTAAEVRDALDRSIACSRSLTAELSPPVLHEEGLTRALEWLAVWMQQNHGLTVEFQGDNHIVPESEEVKVLLFQSVRELLFNTVKHARVRTAQVQLRSINGHIEVTVADAGVGFDPETSVLQAGKIGGFGLFSIRERLDLLGGDLDIDSAPGRGSRFTMRVPCKVAGNGL